jgi:hypothetical protein
VHGLVDGAVSPEEPVIAYKPDQRKQVSTRVSTVNMTEQVRTRPTQAHEQNHPQGVLDTRPIMASKQNDPHGLLEIRPIMAHKQKGKLNIRPITLLEPIFKLIEAIILYTLVFKK